jgi:hypothetical protein
MPTLQPAAAWLAATLGAATLGAELGAVDAPPLLQAANATAATASETAFVRMDIVTLLLLHSADRSGRRAG